MSDTERNARHEARMKKLKAIVDERIANATEERGVFIVMTGNGKGKSSSAFGTMARALGHGQKVGVVQFLKGETQTGEYLFFKDHPNVDYHLMGDGFTWETQNREKDTASAMEAWKVAESMLANEAYDLLVFDEITYMFKYDYLPLDDALEAIARRPIEQSLIITGRGAKKELQELADTVSIVNDEKHAFHSGIKARQGIEY